MKIEISGEVCRGLKVEIFRRFGDLKKGDIKSTVEEAIRDWIEKGGGKVSR